jgi:hypothetical protein
MAWIKERPERNSELSNTVGASDGRPTSLSESEEESVQYESISRNSASIRAFFRLPIAHEKGKTLRVSERLRANANPLSPTRSDDIGLDGCCRWFQPGVFGI